MNSGRTVFYVAARLRISFPLSCDVLKEKRNRNRGEKKEEETKQSESKHWEF